MHRCRGAVLERTVCHADGGGIYQIRCGMPCNVEAGATSILNICVVFTPVICRGNMEHPKQMDF